jgi:2-iminobutanoate/2-iminopropanoate deaminase
VSRTVVVTEGLPAAAGPYSYAVPAGGWVFTAGLHGVDATGALAGGASRIDARAQARQALDNLARVLGALGVPLAHVAKVKGYLTDFAHAAAYNAAYRKAFTPPWPARATAGVGPSLDHRVLTLEAIAAVAASPRVVAPTGRAAPPVPLSQGRQAAEILFASGQLARDARGRLIGRDDPGAQAAQALDNLGGVLAAAGMGFADVVKINTTVTGGHGLAGYDEAFARSFAVPLPAHAIVQGAPGVDGMLIEIEAVAARGTRRVVESTGAWPSRAVRVGTLVHLVAEVDHAPGERPSADAIRAPTRRALESVRRCLEELDGRLQDVVQTTVTLVDHRLLPELDAEYAAFFEPPYPARTTTVAGLARKARLATIEAVAILGAADESIAVTGAG